MEALPEPCKLPERVPGDCRCLSRFVRKAPHGLNQAESLILASLIRAPNAPFKEVLIRALLLGKTLGWPVQWNDIDAAGERITSSRIFIKRRETWLPMQPG